MADVGFKPTYCREAGVVKLYGTFTTTTSGTIGSSSCKGFSVAKTATETGRYTVTLGDKWNGLLGVNVAIEGAADAAYTASQGLCSLLRNVDVSSAKTLDIQFADPATSADAELEDGAKVYIEITLKNSSAW